MTTRINRQWRLATRPVGLIDDSVFTWTEEPVRELNEGEFLVHNLYLSLDPTNRMWAQHDTYLPAVPIGDVMRGGTIGVVEASRNPNFPEGAHVQGLLGWQDYAISKGPGVSILPVNPHIPLSAYMGLFGHIGMTAYFGLLDIGQPKEGETLVVSAAAGAVGSIVGQIGKIKGCHVVGIAGNDDKCDWIVKDLGFDSAINYKKENVAKALKEHCPKGIDIDFENVGGEILDAILAQINLRARIVLCGLISQYNSKTPQPGPYNFANVLVQRARIEGFIVLDYAARANEAFAELGQWMKEGKLKYRVDEVEGLEHAPQALNKLFEGSNIGKLVVKM
ncbi:MAG TPA: NADP-dependent oxidoreductase [Acidobacteriota bacterium]|nr:NADP-dependent oxidoreductase [Acidobacteriota bacterium]HMZ81163.1 NADP-dependent oxidoreductase [Acidobacteriota bacterium]HNC44582.1 NADP-dependent oxidoreductase [Acidobacteriota bacterium]HND19851.1 NADP-dependent oxidoreductase [Acidobacteriota bacterium]HNG95261.1 NADP-dependent oxidoreductase [Acidobacteriota bacterium]